MQWILTYGTGLTLRLSVTSIPNFLTSLFQFEWSIFFFFAHSKKTTAFRCVLNKIIWFMVSLNSIN